MYKITGVIVKRQKEVSLKTASFPRRPKGRGFPEAI